MISLSGIYKYCFSHPFASPSSVKFFIGIGGGFNLNKKFIINFASPGFEIIAIAEYTFGNCSAENFCVSLSGIGELLK